MWLFEFVDPLDYMSSVCGRLFNNVCWVSMLGLNRMESRTGHCFACLCVSLCAPDMSSKGRQFRSIIVLWVVWWCACGTWLANLRSICSFFLVVLQYISMNIFLIREYTYIFIFVIVFIVLLMTHTIVHHFVLFRLWYHNTEWRFGITQHAPVQRGFRLETSGKGKHSKQPFPINQTYNNSTVSRNFTINTSVT